jgi:hypothetical protein
MKEHRYQWDGVIVGYSLSALIYAFYSGMPVVGYPTSAPWDHERMPQMNLSEYGMGKGIVRYEIDLWNHLYMLLSMGGQVPFADNAASIRINEKALIVSTNNRSRIVRGEYETLWMFDDNNIEGMPPIITPCEDYCVVDWFNVRSGMRHGESKLMNPSEEFVQNIYFYPSQRLHGHHPDKKDVCSESFLHKSQLDDFEYSSTYARFRVVERMKGVGIRGARNGAGPDGKPRHYALKIEFDKRQRRRLAMHTYAKDPAIVYNRVEPHIILRECLQDGRPRPANPYIPKVLLTS